MSAEMLEERYNIFLSYRMYKALVGVLPDYFVECLQEVDSDVVGSGLFVPNDKRELVDLCDITIKMVYKVRI